MRIRVILSFWSFIRKTLFTMLFRLRVLSYVLMFHSLYLYGLHISFKFVWRDATWKNVSLISLNISRIVRISSWIDDLVYLSKNLIISCRLHYILTPTFIHLMLHLVDNSYIFSTLRPNIARNIPIRTWQWPFLQEIMKISVYHFWSNLLSVLRNYLLRIVLNEKANFLLNKYTF